MLFFLIVDRFRTVSQSRCTLNALQVRGRKAAAGRRGRHFESRHIDIYIEREKKRINRTLKYYKSTVDPRALIGEMLFMYIYIYVLARTTVQGL